MRHGTKSDQNPIVNLDRFTREPTDRKFAFHVVEVLFHVLSDTILNIET